MPFPLPAKRSKKSLDKGCRMDYGSYMAKWHTAPSLRQMFNVVSEAWSVSFLLLKCRCTLWCPNLNLSPIPQWNAVCFCRSASASRYRELLETFSWLCVLHLYLTHARILPWLTYDGIYVNKLDFRCKGVLLITARLPHAPVTSRFRLEKIRGRLGDFFFPRGYLTVATHVKEPFSSCSEAFLLLMFAICPRVQFYLNEPVACVT